jgi:hypothetical protein
MDTKLTLRLDSEVIEKAKNYAQLQSRSLSGLIESYLKSLITQTKSSQNNDEIEITPFVKSLNIGITIPNDLDYKAEYSNYLIEKYK